MSRIASRKAGLRVRLAAFAVIALMATLCVMIPYRAYGVCNLGEVTVIAPGSVSVQSGGQVSVSAACSPASSDQYPNCLSTYCPSGCDADKMEGAASGGCLDPGIGQCTCFGRTFSTYVATCTVGTSDPSVCMGSWDSGVLSVVGYAPGTATLTLYPSMRLFTAIPVSLTVTVSANPSAGNSGAQAGSGAPPSAPAGSGAVAVVQGNAAAQAQASGASGSGSAVNQAAPSVVTVVSTIERAAGSSESAANGAVEAEDGSVIAHIDDASTDVPSILANAAGHDVLVSLWGGKDAQAPDYIWEIAGIKLPEGADYKGIDLSLARVSSSEIGIAQVLDGESYTAFSVPGEGKLPCTMQVLWRTAADLANDEVVDVYLHDTASGGFKKVHSNLVTGEGYIVFNLIERGVYVITPKSDLDTVAVGEAVTDELAATGEGALESSADSTVPGWALATGVICVVVVAGGAFALARHKK